MKQYASPLQEAGAWYVPAVREFFVHVGTWVMVKTIRGNSIFGISACSSLSCIPKSKSCTRTHEYDRTPGNSHFVLQNNGACISTHERTRTHTKRSRLLGDKESNGSQHARYARVLRVHTCVTEALQMIRYDAQRRTLPKQKSSFKHDPGSQVSICPEFIASALSRQVSMCRMTGP